MPIRIWPERRRGRSARPASGFAPRLRNWTTTSHSAKISARLASLAPRCVYCSSVHARRFSELTKRPEIIQRLYDEGLDTRLEPRHRAIVDFAAKLTRTPQAQNRLAPTTEITPPLAWNAPLWLHALVPNQ